jgi:hypothetical protein
VTLRARWVTLRARWVTLRARWVTLRARWVTLRARWVTLRARWVTLRARWVTRRARWVTRRARWGTRRARWVTLRARWVTLRARWVTLRARWVTLRARWVTLRARWVTLSGELLHARQRQHHAGGAVPGPPSRARRRATHLLVRAIGRQCDFQKGEKGVFFLTSRAAVSPRALVHAGDVLERHVALRAGGRMLIHQPLAVAQLPGHGGERTVPATCAHERGKHALTVVQLRGVRHGVGWLELHPLTGRKHQLRAHCASTLGETNRNRAREPNLLDHVPTIL